jgi:hypothetical protein
MEETSKKNRIKKALSYKPFWDKLLKNSSLKILALVPSDALKRFDEKVGGYLGSHKRKIRPCIYWKTEEEAQDLYKIVFLTSSRVTPISIDLSRCESIKKNCSWFHFAPRSFVIFSPQRAPICITLKSPALQLRKLIYCGVCENLETLDKL